MPLSRLLRLSLPGILIFLGLSLWTTAGHAAVFDGPGIAGGLGAAAAVGGISTGDLPSFIETVLGRVLTYVNLAALVAIIVAGLYLILGFGDDTAKDRAKKIIIYTCVGLVIINLAAVIVSFFASAFGEDISGTIRVLLDRVLSYVTLAAVIVIVTAGFYLILGFGDDAAKDRAKKMIIYTAAGLLVIYLADWIVRFFASAAAEDVRSPIVTILNNVVNYLALAAVVVVVTAGIYLILGFGDDAAKDRAKKMIIYTLAGLLIVFLSRVIVLFVLSLPAFG